MIVAVDGLDVAVRPVARVLVVISKSGRSFSRSYFAASAGLQRLTNDAHVSGVVDAHHVVFADMRDPRIASCDAPLEVTPCSAKSEMERLVTLGSMMISPPFPASSASAMSASG